MKLSFQSLLVLSLAVSLAACQKQESGRSQEEKLSANEAVISIDKAVNSTSNPESNDCLAKVSERQVGVELKDYVTLISCKPETTTSFKRLNAAIEKLRGLVATAKKARESDLNDSQKNYAQSVENAAQEKLIELENICNHAMAEDAKLESLWTGFQQRWNCSTPELGWASQYTFPANNTSFRCASLDMTKFETYFSKIDEIKKEVSIMNEKSKNLLSDGQIRRLILGFSEALKKYDEEIRGYHFRRVNENLPDYVIGPASNFPVSINETPLNQAIFMAHDWPYLPAISAFFKPDPWGLTKGTLRDRGLESIEFTTHQNSEVSLAYRWNNECSFEKSDIFFPCKRDAASDGLALSSIAVVGIQSSAPQKTIEELLKFENLRKNISHFLPTQLQYHPLLYSHKSKEQIDNYGAEIVLTPATTFLMNSAQSLISLTEDIESILKQKPLAAPSGGGMFVVLFHDGTTEIPAHKPIYSTYRQKTYVPIVMKLGESKEEIAAKLAPYQKKD